ncbi:MAG: EAL domain-containing protein [Rhodocyclaceae bacterium]|nr:EAL domain-containing protein [Rhodocyclaceae bacterium]
MSRETATQLDEAPDEDLVFAPEDDIPARDSREVWRVLAVDDDKGFQDTTALSLRHTRILGRPIQLVQAYSLAEAARCLAQDRDFAVILADVVMETEDAGLRLVKGVRETLGLFEPRIVLLTGQPGFAPVSRIMEEYDLNDYCLKSDLARRGLKQVLTGAIRGYKQLRDLATARKGLQLIIESSSRLAAARSIDDLARGALIEISRLLRVAPEGIVCVEVPSASTVMASDCSVAAEAIVVRAEGRFETFVGAPLQALPDSRVRGLIEQALSGRIAIEISDAQVVFLPREEAHADYAIFLETGRTLEPAELELLNVFATNVSRGFGNVALISRLDRLAFEDSLLGIPNKTALRREIERLRLTGNGRGSNLLLFDVDNYSGLSDALGPDFTDRLLRMITARLQSFFPAPALVTRVNEDIFGIVGHDAQVNLARAGEVFATPIELEDSSYPLTACYAEIPLDTEHPDAPSLKRAAWRTLQQAKRRGGGQGERWNPTIELESGLRYRLHSQLLGAVDRGELHLVYQPQVELASGRIVGAEALLRWSPPSGPVPPDQFIPVAENSALIHSIGRFVVEQACTAIRRLDADGARALVISVNVSGRQLDRDSFIEEVHSVCASHGISPTRLGLEVTETSAVTAFEGAVSGLGAHRRLGGKVAIDDFGTGMASLKYLQTLPFDYLKIDRSFVSRLGDDEQGGQIARMIIELGRSLGVTVIAEGVETEAQAGWLRRAGCHLAQGWLFGRPVVLEQFAECLRNQGRGA